MAEAKAEPRASTSVVTSENLAAFTAKKLGLEQVATLETKVAEVAKPEDKKAADAEAEKAADKEAEEEEIKVKKQNPKIERRFSQITEQRKKAEAAAESAKAEAKKEREGREKAEQEREAIRAKYEPKEVELGPEPQLDLYSDKSQFMKDHAKWAGDKAIRERDAEQAAERRKVADEARIKTWNERQAAARKETPDYDAKISESGVKVSEQVKDAIIDSDVGPKILLYFATEDGAKEAERIGKLTVGGALRAIGKLEAKFADEAEKANAAAAKVQSDKQPIAALAEISKAPAPISPLRGSGAAVALPVNSAGEFTGTYEQYKELRKSGKLK